MINEQLITAVAKLYECRRSLRALRGERYSPEIVCYMEAVRRHALADETDDMTASLNLAGEFHKRGLDMAATWVMAAAVELVEPDEQTPKLTRERVTL